MTDNEFRDSWNFSKMVAINIGSVTLSKEDVLAIDDFINRQKAEIERLEYTLLGVMHSVDKWLEGDELKQDEVNRAATMREKTLQIVERLTAQNGVYETCNARQQEAINSLENSLAISKKETRRYVAQCQTIRSDAVKEFAERLKKTIHDSVYRYWNCGGGGYYLAEDVDEDIDNLVKGFTEGGDTE